jgi:hypothetical protein
MAMLTKPFAMTAFGHKVREIFEGAVRHLMVNHN